MGANEITLRLTTYYPWAAKTPAEIKMEGGVNDRKGNPLRTLEDYLAGRSDHVSLSGDDAAWPYGQKLTFALADGRTIVGRVTDTGCNFRDSVKPKCSKVYRATGQEPIDVCVRDQATKVPQTVVATIYEGDHLDKLSKVVDVAKFLGQKVVLGAEGISKNGAVAFLFLLGFTIGAFIVGGKVNV